MSFRFLKRDLDASIIPRKTLFSRSRSSTTLIKVNERVSFMVTWFVAAAPIAIAILWGDIKYSKASNADAARRTFPMRNFFLKR